MINLPVPPTIAEAKAVIAKRRAMHFQMMAEGHPVVARFAKNKPYQVGVAIATGKKFSSVL